MGGAGCTAAVVRAHLKARITQVSSTGFERRRPAKPAGNGVKCDRKLRRYANYYGGNEMQF
jgi:hypothetical protein